MTTPLHGYHSGIFLASDWAMLKVSDRSQLWNSKDKHQLELKCQKIRIACNQRYKLEELVL